MPILLVGRVFAYGPGEWGSVVLDAALLKSIIRYVSRVVEQSRERSGALPYTLV